MFKKSILLILIILTLLTIVSSLTARQGRSIQGRWNFNTSSPDRRPLPADANEQKILSLLEEIAQTDNSGLIVPLEDGRLLRMLTESTEAKNVVEIGTYNGYSALWFCLAL
jgi:hypothetical protein